MRSTVAEIDCSKVRHNLRKIKEFTANARVMALIKANAYGHGAHGISKILRKEGVEFLGVAFASEGANLRRTGDKGKLHVVVPGEISDAELLFQYDMSASVASMNVIDEYSRLAGITGKSIKCHLFINTGMNRDGIRPESSLNFLKEASAKAGIEFEGILTHFAAADEAEPDFARKQLALFNQTVYYLKNNGYDFKYIHAANSAGIVNVDGSALNLIRPGISIYGYMPARQLAEKIGLQPVLTLKSKVLAIQALEKGETAGYSFNYIAPRKTRVAIIPYGYGDGYFRAFSNRARCIIDGKSYNVVGTVCMDQTLVDIGDNDILPGTEVYFIGGESDNAVTAYELAEIAGTIPYEITTAISRRVPRCYVD
ncbi:MAG: alanine racemase [Candidatus Kapaibacterium sp.]